MNKKLLRTSVIASVMAMAFTASAWAASPQDNYRNADPNNIGKITLEYQDVDSLTEAERKELGLDPRSGIVTPYLDHAVTPTGAEHGQNHPWSYDCGEQVYDTDLTIGELNRALYALSYNDKLLQDQISGASTNDKTIAAGQVALASNGTITLQHVDKNGNINQTTVLTGIASKAALENEVTARQNADTNLQNQITTNKNNIASNLQKINQNTSAINVNAQNIANNTTNITNNTNKINAIEKDYVKSVNVNGDQFTFVSNVNGQQTTTTYTDKHIDNFAQSFNDGVITSTIGTNFGDNMVQTVDISGYVGTQIENKAAYADYSTTTQYGDNTIGDAIQQNTININNNTIAINEINKNNVSKVTVDGDELTFHQTIGGQDETFTYTDKHITGHSMSIDGDSIRSTITTNMKDNNGNAVKYENVVRVGDATIRYDGDNNQAGNTQVTNSTIEEAINNNYNKIVNVENNYVSNIVQKDEHTWKVIQGGQETVTIKDTTLVSKRVSSGSVPNASANNALSYDFDPNTGIPQVFVEFEDTSGNVVQGAIDVASLMVTTADTTDGNIEVEGNGQGFGKDYRLADNVNINRSITVNNLTRINNDGRISGVADGEISANSTEAINGSQLWETNRNMDKLGGRLDKVGAGAAALAALHPLDFDPDDKLQFSAGVGNYKGETAAALGAFYRPTEKVMFSVAGTMGNGENMVNAGVTFALDRKNNVSNSRVAMAHEIQDLRDQVAALTALVSQIAGKGNPLLDTVMFPDVPENHWAYDYVENLQKRGIIEGYPDGNFGGDRSMTRYEYAAMLYRALEKGFPVDGRLLKEFEAELGRIRIDRIKGADDDANKVERVRVNDYEDRDDYGSKLAQVVADAAPAIEEEPAA